jgi:hypothetical protein
MGWTDRAMPTPFGTIASGPRSTRWARSAAASDTAIGSAIRRTTIRSSGAIVSISRERSLKA